MDDPVEEIPAVIHSLTQTPPDVQKQTIQTYFTPNASFIHPLCRTGSYNGSRWVVERIYRWYKIMSPQIDLDVKSVAFDKKNLTLYVYIFQVFSIWLWPFHVAPVELCSVLQLVHDPSSGKYFIETQNDLYQLTDTIKFVMPHLWVFIPVWQYLAALVCVVMSYVFAPVTWWEQRNRVDGGHHHKGWNIFKPNVKS